MNHSQKSVRGDIALGSLYLFCFILVTLLVGNELRGFYLFFSLILCISIIIGIWFRKNGVCPYFNDYISIVVAVIGLCFLVHVAEVERDKVRLLRLYEPYKLKFQTADRNMELFNIVTQNRDEIRKDLLQELQELPAQYEKTISECVYMPTQELIAFEIPDTYRRKFSEDIPMLNEFVEDMGYVHCSNRVVTVERTKLSVDMSLSEILNNDHYYFGYQKYEVNDKKYPINLFSPYAQYIPNTEAWAVKKEELENNLNSYKESFETLAENYKNIGSNMDIDISRNWQTKEFYLSWWNFFLIIALGYQLNSTIIRKN